MTRLLITNAVLILLFMSLVFAVAKSRRRLDTADVAWGPGFILIAWSTLAQDYSLPGLLIAVLVTLWGGRLANHIYQRSKGKSEDRRYRELSGKWKGNLWLRAYFSVFLLQGLLALIISLPVMLATQPRLAGWTWLSVAGALSWLVGFAFEVIGDKQLKDYLSKTHRPKVLETGLWRYSRHPNYFGELLQWWSIGLIALQVSYGWLGLLGPLVLSVLIIFISGIPPIEKRRQKDPDYREYQKRTSVLIPLPRKSA